MKIKNVCLLFLLSFLMGGQIFAVSSQSPTKDLFTPEAVEFYTLQKMISLENEKSGFYRIVGIKTLEIEDTYYHKPALRTVIAYETPDCKNNYYQGTAYSVHCSGDYCPVAIVYQKCY